MGEQRMWMEYSELAGGGNGSTLRGATLHGVRLEVGLRILMVMRDGGVAFQAEKRWGSGQKRLEDGGWGSKRAKGVRDGGVAGRLNRGRVTACA
jgi:hypothetical protein